MNKFMRRLLLCLVSTLPLAAEVHTLTLKEAVDKALSRNPEVVMARMDEMKSQAAIHIARDPFITRLGVGSGLAYSNGFPLSIEGSAPAAFQGKASQYLFNEPQRYLIKQAKETSRGLAFTTGMKREEIAFRVASLYLDIERAARFAETARKQIESLTKVYSTVQSRVEEGRALSVEAKEANVNLLRARQRLETLEMDSDVAGLNLAATLGYPPGESVQPTAAEREPVTIPKTESAAVDAAMESNNDLKRLESNYEVKLLEAKSARSQHLPRVDLVAQYALLTKYSNYDQYFNKFQRNNGQIGASIQVPFLLGPGVKAMVMQAEADQQHIKSEMTVRKNQIALDMHQTYLDLRKAETSRELAQADLDFARAQMSIVLAQMGEGRATLKQVEEARFNENEKWIAFYDAQFSAERTRLNVLRQTGELTASLR